MALSGWGDMNENMDWNTLAAASKEEANSGDRFIRNRNERNSENNGLNQSKSGNLNKNNEQQKRPNQSTKDTNNAQEEELTSFITEETDENYEAGDVGDWADMKQFDDDHDNEWFRHEENKMAELYGGKFIKVKYSSQGRVAYYCELCLAECNAKTSLDSHCGGMKHLKKKDLWEKEKKKPFDVEENPVGPVPPSLVPKPKPKKETWGQNRRAPPSPSRIYNPHGSRPDLAEKLKPSRKTLNYYGSDRYYNDGPLDDPAYPPRSRSPLRGRMLPTSPERQRMLPHYRKSPVLYRDQAGADYRSDARRDLSPRRRYDDQPSRVVTRYSPPPPPEFPRIKRSPSPSRKLNLSSSPAGTLLQKLAECCVKTDSDAELAMNVVGALTKSMKEYAYKNNEVKIAELLMEAELKIGTVKALKAGMKMLSSVTTSVPNSGPEGRSFGRPDRFQGGYSGNPPPGW